jgi:prepilin-type N-terminal cleavage/methylation domain-containing protein
MLKCSSVKMLKCLNVKMRMGFTLVEMLVVIGIFSLIVGAISGIFLSGILSQRRILAEQEISDQTSYLLEYIGRALRMAKKDDLDGVNCLLGDKVNYEINSAKNEIKFRNYKDECQRHIGRRRKLM